MRAAIFLLFFLSGATGLVYETLWAKYLSLVLGHTAHAYTVVLAAFLGGLALGNAWLGPRADKVRNRIRFYAWLELGIGFFGVLSPFMLTWVAEAYAAVLRTWPLAGPAAVLFRLGLAGIVLLPPAILMGGTLPALCRFATGSLKWMDAEVSRLYALNSAGAVLGTLLAAFCMVPALGLDLSTTAAAAVNMLIGIVCLQLAKRPEAGKAEPAPRKEPAERLRTAEPRQALILYWAVFVSGFVSLTYEIAWTRLLSLVLGTSVYSFSIMLAAFIGGIALGSFLIARGVIRAKDPYRVFGLVETGIALSLVLTLPLYPHLPYVFLWLQGIFNPIPATFTLYQGLKLAVCFALMIVPTALIGMTLPLAARSVTDSVSRVGERVGRVFAFNTAGNVLGAVAAGLLLMPWMGLKSLIEAGMFVNWAVGALVLWTVPRRSRRWRWAVVGTPLAVLLIHLVLSGPWDSRLLSSGVYRADPTSDSYDYGDFMRTLESRTVLFYKEDADASVSVIRLPDGDLVLKLNGKSDASTGGDMPTQVLVGQVPMLLKPDAKRVMVIGLGSGVSAGSVLRHPVEHVDIVEISKAVADAAPLFDEASRRALEDPRVSLHIDDAKTALRTASGRYDAVISEPSNPWIAGIGSLYTVEFYREVREKLSEDGVMAQWLHNYEMTDDLLRLVFRTFSSVFEHVTVWSPRPEDIVIVGSKKPLEPDFGRMEARCRDAGVREDLERIGIGSLTTFLSTQLASDTGSRLIAGGGFQRGMVNEDRFPILEYEAPKALYYDRMAELLRTYDERMSDRGGRLYLSRYLKERRRRFTRGELEDAADFHRRYDAGLHRVFLSEWRRLYPRDEKALWAWAQLEAGEGKFESARGDFDRLLRMSPKNTEYLFAAADLEFALCLKNRSYLDRPSSEKAFGYLRRLEKLAPDELDRVWHLMGRIRATEEDYEQAFRYFDRAADFASKKEGEGAVDFWLEASAQALRISDRQLALYFARKAYRHDPGDPRASRTVEILSQ